MTSPTDDRSDDERRLERCIRDLAALSALPSMCVGRTPRDALDIAVDALPTVLACDLVYVAVPGSPPSERGTFRGRAMSAVELAWASAAAASDADGGVCQLSLAGATLQCLAAEIPIGAERGRMLAGRSTSMGTDTDRLLVRTAANVVGTIVATANVLESARRKDDFLAMLGHELRNPLAPIRTAVEILERDGVGGRERDIIDRNSRHLAGLVDDLLDISRVARGDVHLRREEVLLDTVLERAVELASPLISRHRHQLHVARADGVVLEGDPVRLVQIFANILTNAARYTPSGGDIDVSIRRAGERVFVTVRDNGRGIAPEHLSRIFEPFVQADRERDALRGGLGLGLAIVNDLVQRHGGTVSVTSAGLGHGAAFTVELPVASSPARPHDVVAHRSTTDRSGVRVLVVDDNVDLAELLSDALAGAGFAPRVATDARTAIEAWHSFRPHAGVFDLGLPDVDGYELARTLRARHGSSATLIAVSGYGQPSDRARAADAGFDFHFVKPVGLHALLKVLDEHVVPAHDARV